MFTFQFGSFKMVTEGWGLLVWIGLTSMLSVGCLVAYEEYAAKRDKTKE